LAFGSLRAAFGRLRRTTRELSPAVPPSGADRGAGPQRGPEPPLALYVEGPRDRSILRAWAYLLMPSRASSLLRASVILGGRQPERAVEHFGAHLSRTPGARGLCVLDRDGGGASPPDPNGYDLRFFTWSRRHIESYLLVPAAIRRALDLPAGDRRARRVEQVLLDLVPPSHDEDAWRALDAKRLLGDRGPLPQALGRALPLARIARATRETELHADVIALFDEVRELMDGRP
jgi:hypothetical protein